MKASGTKARRREESKQKTREALLDAATALIAEQGPDGPSLDAICERAGYTRGAFYVHFADREALVAAVMERAGAGLLGALLPEGADLAEVVGRFVGAVLGGSYPLASPGGIKPHQLYAACARSEPLRRWYQGAVEESARRLAGALARSQQQGRLRLDLDPEATAGLLMAVVIGAQTMLELGLPVDVGQGAQVLLGMLAVPPEKVTGA
jgi:TetR/AcrR family transcriptional repressor of nem operon